MGLPPPHAMPQVCDSAPSPSPSSSGLGGFLPAPSPPGGGSPARSQGGSSTAARAPQPSHPSAWGQQGGRAPPCAPLSPPPGAPPPIVLPISWPEADERGEGLGEAARADGAPRHRTTGTLFGGHAAGRQEAPPRPPMGLGPHPRGAQLGGKELLGPGEGAAASPHPNRQRGPAPGSSLRPRCPRGCCGSTEPAEGPGPPHGGSLGTPTLSWGAVPTRGGPGDGSELRAKVGREGNQNSFTC